MLTESRTDDLEHIFEAIDRLAEGLRADGFERWLIAHGLLWRAAYLYESAQGSADVIQECNLIIEVLDSNQHEPVPDQSGQH